MIWSLHQAILVSDVSEVFFLIKVSLNEMYAEAIIRHVEIKVHKQKSKQKIKSKPFFNVLY